MTKAPKTAYKLPCQRASRGAYFPLIQANEQAAVTIAGTPIGDTWSLPGSHATIPLPASNIAIPLKHYFFSTLYLAPDKQGILIMLQVTFRA